MKLTGKISKRDDDKFLVYGWASVANDKDGNPVIDSQGDVISIEELEKAAFDFVRFNGTGGEMHDPDRMGVSQLVESFVFTPQKLELLGLPEKSLPQGWFVGFKVHDAETWQKVKNGNYKSFSIGVRAVREAVTDD